jgi:hypothetical protein
MLTADGQCCVSVAAATLQVHHLHCQQAAPLERCAQLVGAGRHTATTGRSLHWLGWHVSLMDTLSACCLHTLS